MKKFFLKPPLLLSLLIMAGCSACSGIDIGKRQYTLEDKIFDLDQNFPILALTSFENVLFSLQESNYGKSRLPYGGKEALEAYLEVLKEKSGENLILGHIPHSNQLGEAIEKIRNLPYDFITPGRAMIDHHIKNSPNRESETGPIVLASNLLNIKENQLINNSLIKPYLIFDNSSLVVLSFNYPLPQSQASQLPAGHIWEDPILSLLRIRRSLSGQDIKQWVIILNTHEAHLTNEFLLRAPQDVQYTLFTMASGVENAAKRSIISLAESEKLPLIHLAWKNSDKKLENYKVMTCHKFSELTRDCYLPEDPKIYRERLKKMSKDKSSRIPAVFWGNEIKRMQD